MTPPDAHRAVLRALERLLPAGAAIIESRAEPWHSATFSGARHRVRLACGEAGVAGWLVRTLPEHPFALAGHLVADAVGIADADDPARITAELLTVEEY